MAYRIDEIEGIGSVFADKLAMANITTTDDLLKVCGTATGRRSIAIRTGIGETHLLKWANMADLMRIKGIGGEYAELLEASGVDTVAALQGRRPDHLADEMNQINEVKHLTRATPAEGEIAGWIESAKRTPPAVTT